MEARLVFSINPGRSGSEYLARLLGTAEDTVAFHEAEPTMTGPHLQAVMNRPLPQSYGSRRHKAASVRDTIIESGVSTYCDTSHMFIKTFHDVIMTEFPDAEIHVIVLRRWLPRTLKSFVEMGYFTSRNAAWPDWMHSAWSPQAHEQPPLALEDADQLDRALAYLIDIEARAPHFRASHPRVQVHEVGLEELQDDSRVSRLFADLGLNRTSATAGIVGQRVNVRAQRKRQIGLDLDLDEAQRRIEQYLTRYDMTGRPRPLLPHNSPDEPPRRAPQARQPPATSAATSRFLTTASGHQVRWLGHEG